MPRRGRLPGARPGITKGAFVDEVACPDRCYPAWQHFPVLAQTSTPRIDRRQENQQDRIGAGVAKGDLTPREAINLERGQARIDRMEYRAKADGVVTARERARINHAQNVESAKIYNKRHNARRD